LRERPFEPDTGNAGAGIREKRLRWPYPKRDAVFYFMRLTINGEINENVRAVTLRELLEELGITSGRVAVEVNMKVIKKADYESFGLHYGDVVEIVNFVGGGGHLLNEGEECGR
jgi:sulfur carrier protein